MLIFLKNTTQEDIAILLPMLYSLAKSDGVNNVKASKEDLIEHFYTPEPAAFAKFIIHLTNDYKHSKHTWVKQGTENILVHFTNHLFSFRVSFNRLQFNTYLQLFYTDIFGLCYDLSSVIFFWL